jgi:hypothetical protein
MYEHKMLQKGLGIENMVHELAPKNGAVKGQYIRLMNRGNSVGIVIQATGWATEEFWFDSR